jgi:hypothetical protein
MAGMPNARGHRRVPDGTEAQAASGRSALGYVGAVRRKAVVLVVIALLCAETVVLVRRRGYLFGANTVVRCRSGHLFTTLWIPGGSLKAVRLGWWRLQRCPVGGHWSLVTPAQVSDLTEEERHLASERRDLRVP